MSRSSRSRRLRLSFIFVWISILGIVAFPAPKVEAQADDMLYMPFVNSEQDGSSDSLVTSIKISAADQQKAMKFWTHEAIAAATPLEVEMSAGPATVDEAAVAAAELLGPPGLSGAGGAAPNAAEVAQAAYAADWAAVGAAAEADSPSAVDGTSQIYTRYIVNQNLPLWKIYPHVWAGRLSFSTPSGTSYCSGTSISGNIMLTAAHCLYNSTNNQFYSNWAFTPAYRNGSAPYGTFVATNCWVLTTWVNLTGNFSINSWTRHDVGVCNMGNNSAGQTLNNAVGWMGRQWNRPYVRHFHLLGYPFNNYLDDPIPDAGRYLQACVSEAFQQTTETRGTGCDRSRGMSGGPWVVNYAPTLVSGNADGVSSGFFIGTKNLYGARFNSSNIVVLCNAAGC